MGWKDQIQIRDLSDEQRLEMTCKRCGHVHYLTRESLIALDARLTLYLDEVEQRARCKARGCNSPVRMSLVNPGETSGFVGGLA